MSLHKDAILDLKTTGFDVAEVNGNRIARLLDAAEKATKALGATASRIGPALAPAGAAAHRIAEQFRIADAKARGASAGAMGIGGAVAASATVVSSSSSRMIAALDAIEKKAEKTAAALDRVRGGGGAGAGAASERLRAASTRVRLAGGALPSSTRFAADKLRALREGGGATTAGADIANPSGLAGLGSGLARLAGPAAAAAGAVYAVERAGEALFRTIGRGEKVAQIATGFDTLSAKVGGSAAVMASLERATGGGVAQTDLMTAANRLLVADLGLSRERMEKLTGAGVLLGKSLGISATDAVERMSLALAKQEPELLDELGIKVDLTKAIHDYAAANHVAVDSVDAQTRAKIFLGAVEEQAISRAGKLGASVTAAATPVAAMTKKWSDFQDRMSKLVSDQPGFSAALGSIAEATINIVTALEPAIQLAGKLATALSYVAAAYGKVYGAAATFAALPADLAINGNDAAVKRLAASVGMGGAGGSGGGPSSPAARSAPIDLSPATIAALARALRGESPLANSFGG